jgi:hypothetical protein
MTTLDLLEDDDTDERMAEEEEEEEPLPPCGPLQAALIGSFESAHRESTMRVMRIIVLKQTNVAIANCVATISVDFATKEASAKRPMAVEWRVIRLKRIYNF